MSTTSQKHAENLAKKKKLAAKTEYLQRKKAVIGREKNNYDKIILFRSLDDWWKIVGRSVVYYRHIVGPRTGVERKIIEDTDFDYPSPTGVISVKDPDQFFELALERGGFKESKDGNEDFRALELSNKVSDEAYNKMAEIDDKDWEIAENMILPRVVWPELKVKSERLAREIREATRTFPKDIAVTLGNRIFGYVLDLEEGINRAAKGFVEPVEALEAMLEAAGGIGGDMLVVINLRCLRMGRIQRIAELLTRVEQLISLELRKARGILDEKDEVLLYDAETEAENSERLAKLLEAASTPEPRTPFAVVERQNKIKKLAKPAKRTSATKTSAGKRVSKTTSSVKPIK